MITSILAAIVVLGFLIVVHEFGHFIVAKRSGVGVLKFSVGFGPRCSAAPSTAPSTSLSAIPLGGFVKMVGEDPDDERARSIRASRSQHQTAVEARRHRPRRPGLQPPVRLRRLQLVFAIYGARVPSDVAKVGGVDGRACRRRTAGSARPAMSSPRSTARRSTTWDELSKAIRASGGQAGRR